MKTFEITKDYRGRELIAQAQVTEEGIDVLVAGGDLAHIGAVSVIGPDQPLLTIVFPGHKEGVITERWARRLFEKCKVPVVVSAGIHYDHITKAEITDVVEITGQMLGELAEELSPRS